MNPIPHVLAGWSTAIRTPANIPIGSTADEYKLRIEREIAKWSEVIRAGNIQPGS